jgi:hypothetical protein
MNLVLSLQNNDVAMVTIVASGKKYTKTLPKPDQTTCFVCHSTQNKLCII